MRDRYGGAGESQWRGHVRVGEGPGKRLVGRAP